MPTLLYVGCQCASLTSALPKVHALRMISGVAVRDQLARMHLATSGCGAGRVPADRQDERADDEHRGRDQGLAAHLLLLLPVPRARHRAQHARLRVLLYWGMAGATAAHSGSATGTPVRLCLRRRDMICLGCARMGSRCSVICLGDMREVHACSSSRTGEGRQRGNRVRDAAACAREIGFIPSSV